MNFILLAIAVKESAKVGGKTTSFKGVDDLGMAIIYIKHLDCSAIYWS